MSSASSGRWVRVVAAVAFLAGVANCGGDAEPVTVPDTTQAATGEITPTDEPGDAPTDPPTEPAEEPSEQEADQPAEPRDDPSEQVADQPAEPGDEPDEPATGLPVDDPLSALMSPDVGEHCADGLSADELTGFFSSPMGGFQGADYQRAIRLPDDRVLWTFQDAFLDDTLVHNAALVQSGRCFTLLNDGQHSWLFAEATRHTRFWYWPLHGAPTADGSRVAVFMVEMTELGETYLSHPLPLRVVRVELDSSTLEVTAIHDEPLTPPDLYGWSVTDDGEYSYLYSHCHRQFGYDDDLLGFAPCARDVKLARVPLGDFDGPREYWDGWVWTGQHERAEPVVDGTFVFSGINPAQFLFDGTQFVLIEKRDDWWGKRVMVGVSRRATGPFDLLVSFPEPLACDRSTCNTYFASWVPWREPDGSLLWAISCNLRDGAETCRHLDLYGPRFETVYITPARDVV